MKENKNKIKNIKVKKKSNKILLLFLCFLLILIGVGYFLTYRNYVKNYKYSFKLTTNKITVKLNDTINPNDYIKEEKNVKVEYNIITTNTIGKRYLSYRVTDNFKRRHFYYIDVYVIDDIAPVIEGKDKVTVYTGIKLDLKTYIKATDNYDKELNIDVDGTVDASKEGVYKINYIVTDKSGNKAEKQIEFTVKKKDVYVAPPVENGTFGITSKGYKIVNKGGATYINGILVANKTYNLSSSYGNGLTSTTKSAFNEMKAAAKENGFNLYIGSGYRSYSTQSKVYKNYVKRDGKAKADTYSARPGHSEHQSGLAIDICDYNYKGKCINSGYNNTESAKWLSDNAYKYGFILRYPNGKTNETGYKYESWHYRYVGKDLAAKLYDGGYWITLESYLGITSKYSN